MLIVSDLDCLNSPYISCKPVIYDPEYKNLKRQTLHLPHSLVVSILEVASQSSPLGFVDPSVSPDKLLES